MQSKQMVPRTYFQGKNKDTNLESKLTDKAGEGEGGINWERGSDIWERRKYTELAIWMLRPPHPSSPAPSNLPSYFFSNWTIHLRKSGPFSLFNFSPALLQLVCLPNLWFSKFCYSKTKCESVSASLRLFSWILELSLKWTPVTLGTE